MRPERIILHHSLTKDSGTVSWGIIRKYHMEMLRWNDIGYHFGIELARDSYEIFVGRMLNEQGAHTLDNNQNSIGICFIGNFDVDEVNPIQWNLGIKLVTSLCKIYLISTDNIFGHKDFANKSCPGSNFSIDLFKLQVSTHFTDHVH